jgi:hypothetical protein
MVGNKKACCNSNLRAAPLLFEQRRRHEGCLAGAKDVSQSNLFVERFTQGTGTKAWREVFPG